MMNASVDVDVPIHVNIPINVSTPIGMNVSVNMNVSVGVDVPIYIDVFAAIIPGAVTVAVMVLAISRRYNYSRAVTTATVITITIVAASPVIATGRINFTRLKSQCGEGQRQNRKQCFHTVPSFVNNIPHVDLSLHLRRALRHCRLRRPDT